MTEKQALKAPPKGLAEYKPLDSTNGTFNIILLVLFALGAWFGIPKDTIHDLFVAAVPVVMGVIELIKRVKDSTPRWTGNIITYGLAALAAAFPLWGDAIGLAQPLIDAISSGEFSWIKILPLLIPILNQLAVIWKTRNDKVEVDDDDDGNPYATRALGMLLVMALSYSLVQGELFYLDDPFVMEVEGYWLSEIG